jgi:hypothetical protein
VAKLRLRLGGSCLIDGLLRVDLMFDDNLNRLVANEVESLEACYAGTEKTDRAVQEFLVNYLSDVFQFKVLPLMLEKVRRAATPPTALK